MSFLHRPQQVLVRRLLFQVHVWTGLATALYAIFIGVTGAALVFRSDLQQWAYPALFAHRAEGTDLAAPETIIATLEREFPGYRFSGFDYPGDRRGTFLAYLAKGAELRTLFLDAASGAVVGELPHDGWIQQLQELHFTFQAGQPGYVYNGVAASCLLVMSDISASGASSGDSPMSLPSSHSSVPWVPTCTTASTLMPLRSQAYAAAY